MLLKLISFSSPVGLAEIIYDKGNYLRVLVGVLLRELELISSLRLLLDLSLAVVLGCHSVL